MTHDRIYAWVWDLPYPSQAQGKHEWNAYMYPAEQDCAAYLLATPAREAADDMLDALEQLIATLDNEGEMAVIVASGYENLTAPSRAAIAKARGVQS